MRNLQEQVIKAFCYQKLFWPFTVWINCSSDLKYFANSHPSASNFKSFSRSLEHFFLTEGQNNFENKIPKHNRESFCCQIFCSDEKIHIVLAGKSNLFKIVDSWQNLPVFAIFSFIWQANFITKIGFTDMFQGLKFGHWSITLGITNWRTPFKQSWSTFNFGNLKWKKICNLELKNLLR